MGNFTIITLDMLREHIFKTFPEFKIIIREDIPNMYSILQWDKMGYFISIKVPNPKDYGEAIHLQMMARIKLSNGNIRIYVVYPKVDNKKGRGHFISKSIARTENWKDRITEEIEQGIVEFRKTYDMETLYVINSGNFRFSYRTNKRKQFLWLEEVLIAYGLILSRPEDIPQHELLTRLFKADPNMEKHLIIKGHTLESLSNMRPSHLGKLINISYNELYGFKLSDYVEEQIKF